MKSFLGTCFCSICFLMWMYLPSCVSSQSTFGEHIWKWDQHSIPAYNPTGGVAFGNGLYVDAAYDPQGVSIVSDKIRFYLNPVSPTPPSGAAGTYNFRSEFRTAPWGIRHPIGTEQWIGWRYIFSDTYTIDETSPFTIFQNHPGISGQSPQFELEVAGYNTPRPATGGEIQLVNSANGERIVYPVKPQGGDTLDIVMHIVYGRDSDGLLQLWMNGTLYYNKKVSTVYNGYQWGGNCKWGIYRHTHYDNAQRVQNSINAGAGEMEIFMGTLHMIKRSPGDADYLQDAFNEVSPSGSVVPPSPSGCGVLEGKWENRDIGAVQSGGEVCYDSLDNSYAISAYGADIWNTQDEFHYLYHQLNGDGEISVKANVIDPTHEYAKGGVMIRESLTSNAKHVSAFLTPSRKALQYRSQIGGSSLLASPWTDVTSTAGLFTRLVRIGDIFAGFTSTDGRSWRFIDAVNVQLNQDIFAGIALSSHDDTQKNTTSFELLNLEQRDPITTPTPQAQASITAEMKGEDVIVFWNSSANYNESFFIIEKSQDGIFFEKLGHVFLPINLDEPQTFRFVDTQSTSGRVIYRVKQTNYNGSFGYVGSVNTNFGGISAEKVEIYPNPNSSRQLSWNAEALEVDRIESISLLDLAGRQVFQYAPSSTAETIHLPENLPDGLYFFMLKVSTGIIGKRVYLK